MQFQVSIHGLIGDSHTERAVIGTSHTDLCALTKHYVTCHDSTGAKELNMQSVAQGLAACHYVTGECVASGLVLVHLLKAQACPLKQQKANSVKAIHPSVLLLSQ